MPRRQAPRESPMMTSPPMAGSRAARTVVESERHGPRWGRLKAVPATPIAADPASGLQPRPVAQETAIEEEGAP
jgi:hypothetical protein